MFFVAHLNTSGHWTWLGGNYSAVGVYPANNGGSRWPGVRSYSSWGSISDTLYLFGGYGLGNSSAPGNYSTNCFLLLILYI